MAQTTSQRGLWKSSQLVVSSFEGKPVNGTHHTPQTGLCMEQDIVERVRTVGHGWQGIEVIRPFYFGMA